MDGTWSSRGWCVAAAILGGAVGASSVRAEPAASDPHDTTDTDTVTDTATDAVGEVIVVTGTRSETPLAASPVTTEVIDRKTLEQSGAATVADALALRPGLWIERGVAGGSGLT